VNLNLLGVNGSLAILFSSSLYIPVFLFALGTAYLNDIADRRILQHLGFGFMTLEWYLLRWVQL